MNQLFDARMMILKGKYQKKEELLFHLSTQLFEHGYISDAQKYYEEILNREAISTTYIGNAIAIPHARSPHVLQSIVGFCQLEQEIQWDQFPDSCVKLVFLFVVSDHDIEQYLSMLSQISTRLMDDTFVQSLKEVGHSKQVFELLNNQKLP